MPTDHKPLLTTVHFEITDESIKKLRDQMARLEADVRAIIAENDDLARKVMLAHFGKR